MPSTHGPLAAAKHSLRALARRWRDLHDEITTHGALPDQLVRDTAPQLVEAFGIGADTAAEMLIVAGDNPAESATRPPGPSSAASPRSPPPPG